ncbi:MAG: hypothetical protein PHQ54_05640, partial [Candidatus Omnitrophica bacterium]|nr:hypothetical protein [Candidatus Omnitrophota bacterium]
KKIQGLCRKFSAQNKIIIYGDKNHHEVQSLMDYCGNNAIVIDSSEEVSQDILAGGCVLISQSTKDEKRLLEIYRELHKRGLPKSNFYNTICNDIKTRQNQINSLKSGIDIILVLGSKSSANTANIFSLAQKVCAKSFLVSDPEEFPEDDVAQAKNVVLATGASTPDTFLSSVEKRIKNLYKRGE